MIFQEYLSTFLSYMLFLPTTLLCYMPAKNHLRLSQTHIVIIVATLSIFISVILSLIAEGFSLDASTLSLPVIAIMFIVFHLTTTMHISKSLAVYLLACNCSIIFNNYAIIYDAFTHPTQILANFSLSASILLVVVYTLFCVACIYPMSKYGAYIIDNLSQPHVWWTFDLISLIFFLLNIRLIVHQYSTLHTNNIAKAYIALMIAMFVLMVLFCVIFYYIVNALVEKARTEDENHILKMQEKQYISLQRYIDSDAKMRHDFRQTIYTLKELSSEKDIDAIDEYLCQYIETLPQKETVSYCSDHAVNALLNYYVSIAKWNNIQTNIRIKLPKKLYIDSINLCSIIGNILENAIAACFDIPKDRRFIRIVISEK